MDSYTSQWWNFPKSKITNVEIDFSYIEFKTDEYTTPFTEDGVSQAPRWVSLHISSDETFQTVNDIEQQDIVIGYPGEDNQLYILTEAELQGNWVGFTPESADMSVNASTTENVNSLAIDTHLRRIAQGLPSIFNNEPIDEINDSSNLPKITTEFATQPVAASFPASYFDSIAEAIYRSPTEESSKIWEITKKAKITTKAFKDHKSTRYMTGNGLNGTPIECASSDGGLAGVIVQRYAEGYRIPEFTKFIPGSGEPVLQFEDRSVLYGKSYEYVMYPVIKLPYDNNASFLIVQANDYRVSVDTVEFNDPEPPEILSIDLQGTSIVTVKWRTIKDQVFYSNLDEQNGMSLVDDIKGIQIFIRESLEDPYSLVKYLQYSDVQPQYRERPFEFIPREYIEDLETNGAPIRIPTSYDIRIRPNRDYYLALCSIDAHGNSSGYSAQYRIRRNSVTGEFTKEVVSYSHAPKVQPNLKLIKPIALSSFKASGYKMCTIYQNPDSGEVIPDEGLSLQVQMIDVQTDIFQTIDYNFSIDN